MPNKMYTGNGFPGQECYRSQLNDFVKLECKKHAQSIPQQRLASHELSQSSEPLCCSSRAGGVVTVAYTQPGSQRIDNTNRPTLQLLYDSTTGGNDRYTVLVGPDVQPGNVYQIAAPGVASKTATATTGSTVSSIALSLMLPVVMSN